MEININNIFKVVFYVCLAIASLILIFSILAPKEGPLPYETMFSIDTVGNVDIWNKERPLPVIVVSDKNALFVLGWAVDDRVHLTAGGVEINIDGKLYPATYGLDRPDVAKAYNIPAYGFSGFTASIPVSEIGKGEHLLALKIFTNDKKAYFPSGEKIKFEIK